jgi:hypothetical protein
VGRGFAAALGLALALPFALAGTTFLVVPTTEGLWRGIIDPPSAGRIAFALTVGAVCALAAWQNRRIPSSTWRPLLIGLLAAAPIIPVLTGHGLLLLVLAWPLMRIVLFAAVAIVAIRVLLAHPWPRQPPEGLWPALVFAVYAALSFGGPGPAGPQGDEPHYLTMAESLRSDGDLDLRDEMEQRAYSRFYSGTLAPHTSPASAAGHEYSIHTPGLAALLLPAYSVGGYAGARLLLSLLAAVTAWVVFRLARDVTGNVGMASVATGALALTPPFAFYAMSIYPEMPVALAAALLLAAARDGATPRWHAAAVLAAAAVPWLHPKYLPMAAIGIVLTLRRHAPIRSAIGILALSASVAGLLFFMHMHYGQASFAAAYGSGFADDVAPSRAPWGAFALLFDRQFGLFVLAPLWMLAIPGGVLLWRLSPRDTGRALLVAGAAFGVNACFSMWWGGTCPPARFLVPCLPALALWVAMAADRRPALAAALIGAGFGVLALAEEAPRALHNRADGESALLRVLSRSLDLDRLLPSFVVDDPAVWVLTASMLAVFALVWAGGIRGLAIGAIGYCLVVAGVRTGPVLDAHGATLALLDGYDDRALVAVSGPLKPETLRLPLRLPDAPWEFTEGVLRRSRPVDLAPGRYRVEVEGTIVEALPTAHVVRLDVLADDERIGRTYLEDGQPPPSFDLDLRQGARRVILEATGIQGTGRITTATVLPKELLPRRERRTR